jgi:hypothetical protein
MSQRLILRLLLVFALAFSGNAAQLHSLAHAQADLAAAGQDKAPAPLKHSTDQCLVVHALDGTAADTVAYPPIAESSHYVVPSAVLRIGKSHAAAFQSRAPPLPA